MKTGSMTRMPAPATLRIALLAVAAAFAMSGCSADDVEFNGGLFNAMGLNNSKGKSADPKLASRPGLVVPPDLQRLPAPGEQPGSQASDIAAIDDPDKKLQVSQAELEKQQAAYCEKNYHDALQRGDQDTALAAEGPLGPCRGSFLNLAKGKPAE